jgi:hypothetical protein
MSDTITSGQNPIPSSRVFARNQMTVALHLPSSPLATSPRTSSLCRSRRAVYRETPMASAAPETVAPNAPARTKARPRKRAPRRQRRQPPPSDPVPHDAQEREPPAPGTRYSPWRPRTQARRQSARSRARGHGAGRRARKSAARSTAPRANAPRRAPPRTDVGRCRSSQSIPWRTRPAYGGWLRSCSASPLSGPSLPVGARPRRRRCPYVCGRACSSVFLIVFYYPQPKLTS